jgi:hypothetical protein
MSLGWRRGSFEGEARREALIYSVQQEKAAAAARELGLGPAPGAAPSLRPPPSDNIEHCDEDPAFRGRATFQKTTSESPTQAVFALVIFDIHYVFDT